MRKSAADLQLWQGYTNIFAVMTRYKEQKKQKCFFFTKNLYRSFTSILYISYNYKMSQQQITDNK